MHFVLVYFVIGIKIIKEFYIFLNTSNANIINFYEALICLTI